MNRHATSLSVRSTESDGWRLILLLAMPVAAVAFCLGAILDPLSGQGTAFDRPAYPALTMGLLLLELILWRSPKSTGVVVTTLVLCWPQKVGRFRVETRLSSRGQHRLSRLTQGTGRRPHLRCCFRKGGGSPSPGLLSNLVWDPVAE
ncbi:hypothetical protein [Deinococcus radiopugnans]|uniref:Uncharacterized protein n=1 Tax=Deinococcus radiopugnans ATCC 19172 TaxID=585398 RepID=A0ABR6NSN6_9DEIO|nr:hypothetical protein [Deinococcus radiopugnans]MBB6017047.1 hypothetical protein [Deinococcus radiopugnans ATCC 19172]